MDLDWYVLWDYRGDLLRGLGLTVGISLTTILGATLLGLAVGCLRALPGFFLHRMTGLYVEVMRNIPVVVKLFFAHFVIGLDALPAGLIVLILHQSAYIADITAAGLRSVPLGQAEAAGARVTKPAAETFWGGYSGYFADLDGHLWEVAWNPFWTLDDHA